MKIISKVLLTLLFIPAFLILLILISLKFQFLNSNFWTNTFERHGVYQNLETVIPKIIDYQIKNSDEVQIDKKTALKLFTRDNLKEFIEKNINHSLNYINGKDASWTIFIPSTKLPKGLLPNFLLDKEEVSLDTFMSFLGRGQGKDLSSTPSQASLVGRGSLIALCLWSAFVLLLLFMLYRAKAVPIALFTTGAVTLLLIGVLNVMKTGAATDLVKDGKEPAQLLLGTLAPPMITEITKLWIYIAIVLIIISLVLGYLQRDKKLK